MADMRSVNSGDTDEKMSADRQVVVKQPSAHARVATPDGCRWVGESALEWISWATPCFFEPGNRTHSTRNPAKSREVGWSSPPGCSSVLVLSYLLYRHSHGLLLLLLLLLLSATATICYC